MNKLRLAVVFFGLAFAIPGLLLADVAGSKDHPLLPRFEGSEIIGYKTSDYDEAILALEQVHQAPNGNYAFKKEKRVEGRITRVLYLMPRGKTTLQVIRNYEKSLKKSDFKTLFSCAKRGGCGFYAWFRDAIRMGGLRAYADQMDGNFRYLASHLKRKKEGDVYVSLVVYNYGSSVNRQWQGRTMAELKVIEIEPMADEMVFVKAEDLAKGIQDEGHAAVHQIHFDTNSDKIEPESKPAIDEIAKLLKESPELKVILVGHTDSQGGLQYNMDLSHRRASSVATVLEVDYAIDSKRLGAAGIGYLAPMASNRTEEGRAMNRRVEIIEQ